IPPHGNPATLVGMCPLVAVRGPLTARDGLGDPARTLQAMCIRLRAHAVRPYWSSLVHVLPAANHFASVGSPLAPSIGGKGPGGKGAPTHSANLTRFHLFSHAGIRYLRTTEIGGSHG